MRTLNVLLIFAFSFLVLIMPPVSQASPKSGTTKQQEAEPTKPSTDTVKAQIEYLDMLIAKLKDCRVRHLSEIANYKNYFDAGVARARAEAIEAGNPTAISAIKALKIQEEASNQVEQVGLYKKGYTLATANMSEKSRWFVQSFRTVKLQSQAKDALAQWMTAVDATSSASSDQEISRFSTMSNSLKLELTL